MQLLPEFPTELSDVHLVMFMTSGMSLTEWDKLGILEREIEIYRRLAKHCASVSIVSYGNIKDYHVAYRFPEIRVITNFWHLPQRIYEAYLTHWALRRMRGKVIVKTNQSHGGDLALRVALQLAGRFIARCGYLISFVGKQKYGEGSPHSNQEIELERKLFCRADQVVVTTEIMRQTALGYGVSTQKIRVIPNYVLTDWFIPPKKYERNIQRIGFTGRLSGEKNLPALIRATAALGLELVLIGDGPDRPQLEALAKELGCRALFLGRQPHRSISAILASCHLFVLPSLYEGHPKALIEGMAAGLPVIGTNVPGIKETITHGKTGWLTNTDPEALKIAISRLATDPVLRRRLGTAARQHVEANLSIDHILELELAMLTAVTTRSAT